MPTKTRREDVELICSYQYKASGSPTSVAGTEKRAFTNSRTGASLLDFRKRISEYRNATTPLTGYRVIGIYAGSGYQTSDYEVPLGSTWVPGYEYMYGHGWLLRKCYSATHVLSSGTPTVQSATNARALADFYQRARDAQHHSKGLTVVGELGRTIRMIKHPVQSVRKAISGYLTDLKKGRRIPRRKRMAFVTDTWLEAQYGWKPLLSDVKSAVEDLAEVLHHLRPEVKRITAYCEELSLQVKDVVTWGNMNSVQYMTDRMVTNRNSVRYFGAVKTEQPYASRAENLASKFGFTPDEVLPTVWELVPFSFLIDYFTNLGDIINAASFSSSNFAWYAKTIRNERSALYSGSRVKDVLTFTKRNLVTGGTLGTLEIRSANIARSIPPSLGVPVFQFEIPGTSTKWLNVAALIAQHGAVRQTLFGR